MNLQAALFLHKAEYICVFMKSVNSQVELQRNLKRCLPITLFQALSDPTPISSMLYFKTPSPTQAIPNHAIFIIPKPSIPLKK